MNVSGTLSTAIIAHAGDHVPAVPERYPHSRWTTLWITRLSGGNPSAFRIDQNCRVFAAAQYWSKNLRKRAPAIPASASYLEL
jgi:hypothetical protein